MWLLLYTYYIQIQVFASKVGIVDNSSHTGGGLVVKNDFQPVEDHSEGRYTLMAIISHIGTIHRWIDCLFDWLIDVLLSLSYSIGLHYLLFTVIGKSTDHGHYVCHIKKDNDWILYNDEKVGRAVWWSSSSTS